MIFILGEYLHNCFLGSRIYAERFPNRNHPNKAAFERLLTIVRQTGNVQYEKPIKKIHVTKHEETEFAVIASVIENPHTSQYIITENIGISHASVSRILKKYIYHHYKIQPHQELYEHDYGKRIEFGMWVLDKVADDENSFNSVLFSDNAPFITMGLLIGIASTILSSDFNPHQFRIIHYQQR